MKYIEINPEFEELLQHTQVRNDAVNPKSQESKGASVEYDDLKPEDFIKNNQKIGHTHPLNDEVKGLSQINIPVLDENLIKRAIDTGISKEANEQDYLIARECINYIQTQTFRGLTHKLKKAYECCKELKEFTAKDIHSKFPFVNQKMWYIYLDQLCERNMLTTELRKTEEAKQRITYYMIHEGATFELPEFSLLPETITNVTLVTNDTNVTLVTNDINNTIKEIIDMAKEDLLKPCNKNITLNVGGVQLSKESFEDISQNNCNDCNNCNKIPSFSQEDIQKSAPECQEYLNKIKSETAKDSKNAN